MLLTSVLLQSATNMFNEYFDYQKGLDTADSVGIGGAIVRHGIKPRTVFGAAVAASVAALATGAYICRRTTWWLAPVGLLSLAAGFLYTGGPLPIAYTPLGELTAGFFMGLVIVLVSFFVQAGHLSPVAFWVAVPQMVLIGAILAANNIRDRERDRAKGRKTLAVLLGKDNAVLLLAAMFAFAYLWTVAAVAYGALNVWSLLVFLSLPKAQAAIRAFKGKDTPAEMMPAMKATAQTNNWFGLFLVLALLIGTAAPGR